MKVLIMNVSNTYNYGSMMMAENVITYLNKYVKIDGEIEYYTDIVTNDHIERLKEATGYEHIYMDKQYNSKLITEKIKYVRILERYLRDKIALNMLKCPYDAIIILGGDDYAETYYVLPKQNFAVLNSLKKLDKLNEKSKLIMVGQTIGPYTGERLELAKKVYSSINIYSRDEVSRKYLKDVMNVESNSMRDLAFLDLHLEKEYYSKKNSILEKYDLKENEYVVLVGTDLCKGYTDDEEKFNRTFVKASEIIKKENPDKRLVWLSHVTTSKPRTSDNTMLEKIRDRLDKDICIIDEQILPVEARTILGCGYCTFTCRMHAAVSTLKMGNPIIALSYSPKYAGVISDGLGLSELVIETKESNFDEEIILGQIEEKVKYINENYDVLKEKIKSGTELCKNMADIAMRNIAKFIGE